MRSSKNDNLILYFSAAVLLAAIALRADEPPATSIHGFVDGYYAWNSNQPSNHQNFVPGTGTSAERANEFAINLAGVEFVREPKPVGFHLSLVAGNGTDVVHAADPARDTFRYVYQASLSYNAPVGRGLLLEGGVYPSHIGFEGFFSKDNWTYTRGWMGEFSPFYQAGLKASYAWSDHWSGQLHILNGWQTIGENNDAKAVGTQIAYSGPRLGVTFSTFVGPELTGDNKDLRLFGDWVATYQASREWSLAASLDRGRQQLPGDTNANWLAVSLWSRYTLDEQRAVAIRVESFRDPDNGITGSAQNLSEATLTYEYRPAPNLILKIEGRHDHSTAPVFAKSRNDTAGGQTLIVLGAVATF
jgi:Putative beta-barrel porin-2, OmpL-like. bbp2